MDPLQGKLEVRSKVHTFGLLTPEVAEQMAPCSVESVIAQCHEFGKKANDLFDVLGMMSFRFGAGTILKTDLATAMEALEDAASLAVQIRNSLATHLHADHIDG